MLDIVLNVNDKNYEVTIAPYHSLLKVLRDELGFTDVKSSCGGGVGVLPGIHLGVGSDRDWSWRRWVWP